MEGQETVWFWSKFRKNLCKIQGHHHWSTPVSILGSNQKSQIDPICDACSLVGGGVLYTTSTIPKDSNRQEYDDHFLELLMHRIKW